MCQNPSVCHILRSECETIPSFVEARGDSPAKERLEGMWRRRVERQEKSCSRRRHLLKPLNPSFTWICFHWTDFQRKHGALQSGWSWTGQAGIHPFRSLVSAILEGWSGAKIRAIWLQTRINDASPLLRQTTYLNGYTACAHIIFNDRISINAIANELSSRLCYSCLFSCVFNTRTISKRYEMLEKVSNSVSVSALHSFCEVSVHYENGSWKRRSA